MCISHVHTYMCEFHMCSWICAKHMCVNMCTYTLEFTTYYLLLPPFPYPLSFNAPEGPRGSQQEANQEPRRTPQESTYQPLVFFVFFTYFQIGIHFFIVVFSIFCHQDGFLTSWDPSQMKDLEILGPVVPLRPNWF